MKSASSDESSECYYTAQLQELCEVKMSTPNVMLCNTSEVLLSQVAGKLCRCYSNLTLVSCSCDNMHAVTHTFVVTRPHCYYKQQMLLH